jgi:ADP-heptose:LPS heptosyltransferase
VLAALIADARLLVSNDTGVSHLASAPDETSRIVLMPTAGAAHRIRAGAP